MYIIKRGCSNASGCESVRVVSACSHGCMERREGAIGVGCFLNPLSPSCVCRGLCAKSGLGVGGHMVLPWKFLWRL